MIPAAFDYVSNDCGASFADPTLTWNVGALAASASASCNVAVVVAADATEGPVVNTATASSTEGDSDPANNSADSPVEVEIVTGPTPSILEVPTLDRVGLAILLLGLVSAALYLVRRR